MVLLGHPRLVKERYFEKTGEGFQISSNIRRMVTFRYHNLMDDPYPTLTGNTGALDIIFCRNVLMYFSRERAGEVIGRLKRCLVNDGWFVVSPIEASHATGGDLRGVKFPAATFYRKPEAGSETARRGICDVPFDFDREKRHKVEPAHRPGPSSGRKGALQEAHEAGAASPPPPSAVPQAHEEPSRLSVSTALDAASFALQAKAVADEGRLTEALEMCERALEADKLSASMHYLKATILTEIGAMAEAAASLRRAIYIDQDFVLAHFALGHLMHRQEKYREAGIHFRNARSFLESYGREDILPGSDGMSAVRLMEIIEKMGLINKELK